ncbi:hypothetical protein [Azospirillum palustre]
MLVLGSLSRCPQPCHGRPQPLDSAGCTCNCGMRRGRSLR